MIGVGVKTIKKVATLLTKKKTKKILPKKKPAGFWKGQWLETKAEGRSVWKGTKKLPMRLLKAGWKHPISAGVVIGGGGGLLLGQKRLRYGYGNNKPKKT